MWVVRARDDIYVRSGAPVAPACESKRDGRIRIRARGLERDVTFAEADPNVHAIRG